MDPIQPYLDELHATKSSLVRQHCLLRASNALPPGDLTRLYLLLEGIGGNSLCKMAPYWSYMTAKPRRRAAELPQLVLHPAVDQTQFYLNPENYKADKSLYILVSGDFGEFSIPLSLLIHLLPSGPKDVLVIRTAKDVFYRTSLTGLGKTPYDISRAFKREFATDKYRRVAVIGVSSGGFFAYRLAEMLKAELALSFGGLLSFDVLRLSKLKEAGITAFDPICACRSQSAGRLTNVLASMSEFDMLDSMQIRKNRPKMIPFYWAFSDNHCVLQSLLAKRSAQIVVRLALSRYGIWLRIVAFPLYVAGTINRKRRLKSGKQRVPNWYYFKRNFK